MLIAPAPWVWAVILIFRDIHLGPVATPRRNETKNLRWVTTMVSGLVGVLAGLAVGDIVQAIQDASRGCVAQQIGDCGLGLGFAAIFFGFTLLLAVPIAVLLASAAALAVTIIGWRRSGSGVLGRVHQLTLLVGMSALTWFLWQWNLIGWQL